MVSGVLIRGLSSVFSERSFSIPFLFFITIVLFGVFGPIAYPIDPGRVFYRSGVSVYEIYGDTVKEIQRISGLAINGSIEYGSGFILYTSAGDYGDLYVVNITNGQGVSIKKIASIPGGIKSIYGYGNSIAILTQRGVTIARLGEGLEVDREIAMETGSAKGLAYDGRSIAIWGDDGDIMVLNINFSEGSIASPERYRLGWIPNAGGVCDGLLILAGSGGRIAVLDIHGNRTAALLRPVTEDLLDVRCIQGGFIASGRFGSLAIYQDNTVLSPSTDLVDDLVSITIYGDNIYAIGSRGSLVVISQGSGAISVREIRGLEGVRRALVVNNTLYVITYGSFVASLEPPSAEHPFGTNYYGQDLMAQIMAGVRMSLLIGVAVAILVVTIGSIVGLLSGYFRGRVDSLFTMVVNFVYTIPLEPFAILLAMLLRPSTLTVVIAISALIWRTTARIIRSQTIAISSTQMVEAARAIGAGHLRIISRYILPAVLPIVLLDFASVVAYAILAEATLGFLGVGAQNTYTLGNILNQARLTGAWRNAWWWIAIPGFFIGSISLSIYMIVRSLEPIANPRIRRTLQGV